MITNLYALDFSQRIIGKSNNLPANCAGFAITAAVISAFNPATITDLSDNLTGIIPLKLNTQSFNTATSMAQYTTLLH